jgi:hypothetical protein
VREVTYAQIFPAQGWDEGTLLGVYLGATTLSRLIAAPARSRQRLNGARLPGCEAPGVRMSSA